MNPRPLRIVQVLVEKITADGAKLWLQQAVMAVDFLQFLETDIGRAEFILRNVVLLQKFFFNEHSVSYLSLNPTV